MKNNIKLGEILVLEKKISSDQLEFALMDKSVPGSKIGQRLIKLGYIGIEDLNNALEIQKGFMPLDLQKCDIKEECVKSLPEKLARKNKLIAIDRLEGNLIIAMADPLDIVAIDEINLFAKEPYKLVRADAETIKDMVNKYFVGDSTRKVLEEFNSTSGEYLDNELDDEELAAVTSAPVVKLMNSIIEQGTVQICTMMGK